MIDQTKAVIGQTVFFEEHWSNNIIKGTISEIHDDGARVKCECIVDKDGHDRGSFPRNLWRQMGKPLSDSC